MLLVRISKGTKVRGEGGGEIWNQRVFKRQVTHLAGAYPSFCGITDKEYDSFPWMVC